MADTLVEKVAQALHAHEDSWNDVAWEYLPASTQELFRGQALAALDASPIKEMAEALEPFAACVDQIKPGESDEEWAKFRLLVQDFRRARTALSSYRKGVGDE